MTLVLSTALHCEAKSFIEHFSLKMTSTHSPFPIWENKTLKLVITGVGKLSAASALSYCFGRFQTSSHIASLNIGIAGHSSLEIGVGRLAHKVTDSSSKMQWFPIFAFSPPCPTHHIVTVDQPEKQFAIDALYEMEASGCLSASLRFTTLELTHCYKIISDNLHQPFSEINEKKIQDLIKTRLEEIEIIIHQLEKLLMQIHFSKAEHLEPFLRRWHFTESQRLMLEKLILRWNTLSNGKALPISDMAGCKNGKEALIFLEKTLFSLPLKLESYG